MAPVVLKVQKQVSRKRSINVNTLHEEKKKGNFKSNNIFLKKALTTSY